MRVQPALGEQHLGCPGKWGPWFAAHRLWPAGLAGCFTDIRSRLSGRRRAIAVGTRRNGAGERPRLPVRGLWGAGKAPGWSAQAKASRVGRLPRAESAEADRIPALAGEGGRIIFIPVRGAFPGREPSGRLPKLLTNESHDRHQHAPADAPAGDAGYDAADVKSARGRVGAAHAECSEELAAESAAENAGDRITDRAQAELLEQRSGDIAARGAADQLNQQRYDVHAVHSFPALRIGEMCEVSPREASLGAQSRRVGALYHLLRVGQFLRELGGDGWAMQVRPFDLRLNAWSALIQCRSGSAFSRGGREEGVQREGDPMAKVTDIEGIGPAYQASLAKAGVQTVEALLEKGATRKGRADLAKASGISETLILKWVNHADLFRIHGVAGQYAELLEAAGVDTVAELARRKADNLHAAMVKVNGEKKLVRALPEASQVTKWIQEAKALPRAVEY